MLQVSMCAHCRRGSTEQGTRSQVECWCPCCCRFGPWFVSPVIAGLEPGTWTPYLCGMDSLGAIETAPDFMVAGTAPDSLYGMCESMHKPDLVRSCSLPASTQFDLPCRSRQRLAICVRFGLGGFAGWWSRRRGGGGGGAHAAARIMCLEYTSSCPKLQSQVKRQSSSDTDAVEHFRPADHLFSAWLLLQADADQAVTWHAICTTRNSMA